MTEFTVRVLNLLLTKLSSVSHAVVLRIRRSVLPYSPSRRFFAVRESLLATNNGVAYWDYIPCSWCKLGTDEDGGSAIGVFADYMGTTLENAERTYPYSDEYICQQCLNSIKESRVYLLAVWKFWWKNIFA
jgi:hypothetical protein